MNKILVVDDDQGIRMLYADELTDEGYNVVTCGDGSRLMEFIKEERPDLVVMDMKLGKHDGVDLLQDIRNAFDHLPVILCTAYPSFRHHWKSLVADGYVVKSSDLSELKLKIGKALDERQKAVSFESRSHREETKTSPTKQTGLPRRKPR
jgi:two-component system response regulator (stage 0 sporulation protein F)